MLHVFPTEASLEEDLKRLSKIWDENEVRHAVETASLPFPPKRLNIGITSRCNYNCPFCFNHASKTYDYVRPMSAEVPLVRGLIEKFRGTDVLAFEVMGESLVHPQCLDMMEHATRYVNKIALTTNGSLLTKEVADRLSLLPVHEIFFSCDASDRKTYEQMRVNGSFDALLKNVSYLAEKTAFTLSFNAIVFSMNLESLLGLPKLASDIGIQRIQFVPQNTTRHALRMGFRPASLTQLRGFLPRLMEQCEKHDVAHQFVWSLIPPELSDLVPAGGFSEPCMMPFDSMTIDPFGRINFCCYLEWFEGADAMKTDPEGLWNCRGARLLRALNVMGLFPDICHRFCHRIDRYRENWRDLLSSIVKIHHVNWQEIDREAFFKEVDSFVLWPAGKMTRRLLHEGGLESHERTCDLMGIIDRKAEELKKIQDIPVSAPESVPDIRPEAILITSDTFTKEILTEALRIRHSCRIFHLNEEGRFFAWQEGRVTPHSMEGVWTR